MFFSEGAVVRVARDVRSEVGRKPELLKRLLPHSVRSGTDVCCSASGRDRLTADIRDCSFTLNRNGLYSRPQHEL